MKKSNPSLVFPRYPQIIDTNSALYSEPLMCMSQRSRRYYSFSLSFFLFSSPRRRPSCFRRSVSRTTFAATSNQQPTTGDIYIARTDRCRPALVHIIRLRTPSSQIAHLHCSF